MRAQRAAKSPPTSFPMAMRDWEAARGASFSDSLPVFTKRGRPPELLALCTRRLLILFREAEWRDQLLLRRAVFASSTPSFVFNTLHLLSLFSCRRAFSGRTSPPPYSASMAAFATSALFSTPIAALFESV
ncbi:hypothetical protein GQ54DRAFT_284575 [Martensiomyces pterosporus]|nr:hypothetical protein GQ54DRAFT_284575 [Martensiomyces pterosporus]